MQALDVFFVVYLRKQLQQLSSYYWFETLYSSCDIIIMWNFIDIMTTSNGRHVVSNHRSFGCLFNSLCRPTSKKHQSMCYWLFVRGIHQWPVNSPHKGPVMCKKLPFYDVIMMYHVCHTKQNFLKSIPDEPAPDKCITQIGFSIIRLHLSWVDNQILMQGVTLLSLSICSLQYYTALLQHIPQAKISHNRTCYATKIWLHILAMFQYKGNVSKYMDHYFKDKTIMQHTALVCKTDFISGLVNPPSNLGHA